MMLQYALEREVTEALGRNYYENGSGNDEGEGVSVQLEHDSPEVKIRTWKKELS